MTMTMTTTRSIIRLSMALMAVALFSSAFCLTSWRKASVDSRNIFPPFGIVPETTHRHRIDSYGDSDLMKRTIKKSFATTTTTVFARRVETVRERSQGDEPFEAEQEAEQIPSPRREATIRLTESGRKATLVSRTVPVFESISVTVWEWKNSADLVNAYWEAQGNAMMMTTNGGVANKPMLDPFGLVSWPGSVVAAKELREHAAIAVNGKNVVVLGAGVGVETQAAAMLGPKKVVATDIHPTTLQQLEFGVSRNGRIPPTSVVETQILDLFREEQPIPSPCDLLVVADVLYSEHLAKQVCRRCAEALEANPNIRILVTDSQRFVPTFLEELNGALAKAAASSKGNKFRPATWKVQTMKGFEGSGVIIDEDQTYDVTVQSLWIGL